MKKEKYNKFEPQIDAVLDLHGLSQAAAESAVMVFVQSSERMGHNRIRIITGKGSGVLQESIRSWLRNQRIFFETAKINEGGAGALVITL